MILLEAISPPDNSLSHEASSLTRKDPMTFQEQLTFSAHDEVKEMHEDFDAEISQGNPSNELNMFNFLGSLRRESCNMRPY